MTNYKEEQLMELEALEALFTHEGEFEKINENEFYINILPFADNSKPNHNFIKLKIVYTEKYPDEPPIWSFQQVKGVDESGLEELRILLVNLVENNLGMSVVYNMADAIQVWLREHNMPVQSMHAQMLERERKEGGDEKCEYEDDSEEEEKNNAEDEEEFKGLVDKDLCNPEERVKEEEFKRWAEKFREEMEERGIWKKADKREDVLTGKQMFLQDSTLAITDTEDNDDDTD